MAADSYRRQPSPEHLPFPLYDNVDARDYSINHLQNPQAGTTANEVKGRTPRRSRASSSVTSDSTNNSQSRRPARDAENTAFGNNDAGHLDADFVAQLTARIKDEVINDLKAAGITGPGVTPVQPPQPSTLQSSPLSTNVFETRSPTSSASASMPSRYTPPVSPRHEEYSAGSLSSEPQSPEVTAATSRPTPGPKHRANSRSPRLLPEDMIESRTRPRPERINTAVEEKTTLEKIWQPLFMDGRPTARLGQFLRGLAIHLIEDCEPKASIVVTPAKLLTFLQTTRVADEPYPWADIFAGKMSCASISRLFRDLQCEHHLVQHHLSDYPYIPGLTPAGFEKWMTTLILAHPDMQFERLKKAVLDMPISNADDNKERFPKELSRRLLPRESDLHTQQRLIAAISADPAIQIRNSNPMPPPPAQPPSGTSFTERERQPYGGSFSASAIDDEETRPSTTIPIERERKPYVVHQGKGKVYEDSPPNSYPNSNTRGDPASRPETATRNTRANSVQPPFTQSSSRPTDIPPPTSSRHHRMSATGGRPMSTYGSPASAGPGISNPYTRSEGANVNDIPAAYYASNLHDGEHEGAVPRAFGRGAGNVPSSGFWLSRLPSFSGTFSCPFGLRSDTRFSNFSPVVLI
ncbi:hypothetical protein M8818_006436 [Zalaria obscura]|uniref:Uncharacterized protein n=1 Tax=Zalaria obscura TaxID=2024903 RepID=A0ACC3SA62_9PEZI